MWMLELCLPLVSLWTDFKYFIGHFPDTFWPHGKRDFIMEWDFTIPKLSKSEFTSKFILFFFSIKPSNQYLILSQCLKISKSANSMTSRMRIEDDEDVMSDELSATHYCSSRAATEARLRVVT